MRGLRQGGVRPDSGTGVPLSGTGVPLSAEETREVPSRLGGWGGGGGLAMEKRRGGQTNGIPPTATRESGTGTPGGGPTDPGGRDGNDGDVVRDGVGGRRYSRTPRSGSAVAQTLPWGGFVRHCGAAARRAGRPPTLSR